MIDVNELRKGVTFTMDGNIFKVLDYQHYKPGRGNAVIRTTLRNLRTGSTIEHKFASGSRVQDIRIETIELAFMYNDGDMLHFMNMETYEQPEVPRKLLGDDVGYLKENMPVKLQYYEGEIIDYELPTTVDYTVTRAETAAVGDTATNVTKRVTLETGIEVDVPNFVKEGDVIRVDTRDGRYVSRA